MEARGMVECIRPLLARFPQNEEFVRQLVSTDAGFDALCHQYRKVIDLLDNTSAEDKRLTQLRDSLEEELLTRIEGYQPR
jgi:hypothetical protein